jgi:hypothetical protein
MKPKALSARRCVTRTSRHDPRGAQMEGMATEFALLAQRRTRLARQVDLLAHRLAAAHASLRQVQARMATLAQHIDHVDPALRPAAVPPLPVPPSAPPARPRAATPAPFAPSAASGPVYPAPKPAFLAVPLRPRQAPSPPAELPAPEAPAAEHPAFGRAKLAPRLARPIPRRRPFLPE